MHRKGEQMFAMCQPEVPLSPLFHKARRSGLQDVAYLAGRGCQPDNNLNFLGESYDSNENCCQSTGILMPGDGEPRGDNTAKVSNNPMLLMHRQKARSKPRMVPTGLRSNAMLQTSEEEEEEEEEAVRRPPEGAEVSSLEQENGAVKERTKESGKLATSPLEDNGYASSSLSIDSPDSGGASVWEAPSVAAEEWRDRAESPSPGAEPESPSPSSETLFPALAEAFRNLQDKKKFKEREKEKHHIHLVMYRRLALLRWIRSLQQKVVDQQNRLQESFDTILDNRKELIRCVQQGMGCPKNPTQAEL